MDTYSKLSVNKRGNMMKTRNTIKLAQVLAGAALLAGTSVASAAVTWTDYHKISVIKITSSTGNTYIENITGAGWGGGISGCPDPKFMRLNKSQAAYNAMLAEVYMAKGADFMIGGTGTCVNTNTLSIDQIRMK